ncbi:replicative DNA helicase [Elizabethkingia anophelis]|uniref:replicative DNA helicase n=1 Tax=Elizabethkingia anophelis TaxID=1117645 RepID=UPI00200C5380|nr:replicative DNA helicase [Elizabethkingia anophelis]HAY3555738.1 replicative DNA helicase [Elizabethkingia meningoseptica]MCL1034647.1 replicative DNA helicase [Elizabethkingia anophelis]MDV3507032.1 replicative DNA helicase [Elizabethkingia anophelis]MDV3542454.1 replicative DNA helicase [Elizabethkingia anophelis]MDV3854088.1 replicative DNA helicase [Elizabethkingia anophelis]
MNSNINFEKVILGMLLVDSSVFPRYNTKLSVRLFENKDHQVIFEIINSLWQNNKPVDMMIVIMELEKIGRRGLDKYIIELTLGVSSSASFDYYLKTLVELSVKRDFIEKFTRLLKIANNPTEDVFDIRDKAFEYFDNLFIDQFIEENKQNQTFSDLVNKVQEKFENINPGEVTGIPSSLDTINKAIGGWQNSDLIIVAGRPGMGKTAFMVQQIVDAVKQNIPTGVFSLEMSAEQITGRVITNYTGIPNSSILRKGLKYDEIEKFAYLKKELLSLKIYIDDTPGISIQNLRIKAKMLKLKYNIGIMFVDYLQLATYDEAGNREQEIGRISRGLKAIAKELDIPVIALSQLSRKVEDRPGKRPMLSDLRDSGSIEQDADEVIFLYRPEYYGILEWDSSYNNEGTENEAEIIIAKNRNGGTLDERCRVNLPTSKFMNLY